MMGREDAEANRPLLEKIVAGCKNGCFCALRVTMQDIETLNASLAHQISNTDLRKVHRPRSFREERPRGQRLSPHRCLDQFDAALIQLSVSPADFDVFRIRLDTDDSCSRPCLQAPEGVVAP